MRKIILQVCAISLDGVIQTDGTDFERYFEQIPVDARSEAWIAEAVVGADALVVGRNTYLGMADYFPAAESGPIVDALNRVAKVVLSKTLTSAEWGPVTIAGGNEIAGGTEAPYYGLGDALRRYLRDVALACIQGHGFQRIRVETGDRETRLGETQRQW